MKGGHPSVLLVEDDPLVAMDVETTLAGAGYRVIGPAESCAHALSILRHEAPDVAILDLNLRGEMAFAVFDHLDETGRPFIIVSGHSRQVVPARHARRPFLQKPCDSAVLLKTLCAVLRGGWTEISAGIA
jgi:DNA-binding response OmpR family regulator